jgi:hypothetical protein
MIRLIIVFLHLNSGKPLLIPSPDLKHLERAQVVGIMPEIEEQALRLAGYAFLRGFQGLQEVDDFGGLHRHGSD